MAETLGVVDISNTRNGQKINHDSGKGKKRKWTRRKTTRKAKLDKEKLLEVECGKRNLVDVMILDETIDMSDMGEKKPRGREIPMNELTKEPEVVLDSQHRLNQWKY
ncbi:unnamed protein product [Lathyrus sativus]|nr:unnamed protein product [Lathyrus sativus]